MVSPVDLALGAGYRFRRNVPGGAARGSVFDLRRSRDAERDGAEEYRGSRLGRLGLTGALDPVRALLRDAYTDPLVHLAAATLACRPVDA